jgi:hypothetical protein
MLDPIRLQPRLFPKVLKVIDGGATENLFMHTDRNNNTLPVHTAGPIRYKYMAEGGCEVRFGDVYVRVYPSPTDKNVFILRVHFADRMAHFSFAYFTGSTIAMEYKEGHGIPAGRIHYNHEHSLFMKVDPHWGWDCIKDYRNRGGLADDEKDVHLLRFYGEKSESLIHLDKPEIMFIDNVAVIMRDDKDNCVTIFDPVSDVRMQISASSIATFCVKGGKKLLTVSRDSVEVH